MSTHGFMLELGRSGHFVRFDSSVIDDVIRKMHNFRPDSCVGQLFSRGGVFGVLFGEGGIGVSCACGSKTSSGEFGTFRGRGYGFCLGNRFGVVSRATGGRLGSGDRLLRGVPTTVGVSTVETAGGSTATSGESGVGVDSVDGVAERGVGGGTGSVVGGCIGSVAAGEATAGALPSIAVSEESKPVAHQVGPNYARNLESRKRRKAAKEKKKRLAAFVPEELSSSWLERKELENKLAVEELRVKLDVLKRKEQDGVFMKKAEVENTILTKKLDGSIALVPKARVESWAKTVKSGSSGSKSKGSSAAKTRWSGAGASEVTDISVYTAKIAELEDLLRKERSRRNKPEPLDDTSLKAQLESMKRYAKDKDGHLLSEMEKNKRMDTVLNNLITLLRERMNAADFKNVIVGVQSVKSGLSNKF